MPVGFPGLAFCGGNGAAGGFLPFRCALFLVGQRIDPGEKKNKRKGEKF